MKENNTTTNLRPVFCRIGSKRDIADRIIKLIPDGITTYVEPFVGSGAVLWRKEPHPKEVINDLDTELIKDYKLLKSTKARNFRTDLDTIPELQEFVDKTPTSEADKLTHGIVRRCNKYGSNEKKRRIFNSPNPYNKLKKIDDYQARLKDVIIKNVSYEKVIKQYDSPTTFFYCDPPYELKKGQKSLYKHDDFNQQELRDTLASCKGKWLVSINDSSNIRNMYNGFYYIAFTLKPKGGLDVGRKPRKELFIANYPISNKKLKHLVGGTKETNRQAVLRKLGLPKDTSLSITELAKLTKLPRKALQEVYNRGIGAYKTNLESVRLKDFTKNPDTKRFPASKRLSKEQWGFGRIFSFINKGKTFTTTDKDIAEKYNIG